MRKLIVLSLSLLCVSPVAAEQAKTEEAKPKSAAARAVTGFKTWFQNLKEGLTESSVSAQRQRGSVAAVAAVRGNAQAGADMDKPSWKSGTQARKSKALKLQRKEFSEAVDLAVEGKYAEADQKLAAFEKAHPESPMLGEVKQAREKIKEAQAESSSSVPAQADAKPAQ